MSCRLVVLAEIVNAISCEDPSRKDSQCALRWQSYAGSVLSI